MGTFLATVKGAVVRLGPECFVLYGGFGSAFGQQRVRRSTGAGPAAKIVGFCIFCQKPEPVQSPLRLKNAFLAASTARAGRRAAAHNPSTACTKCWSPHLGYKRFFSASSSV